MTTKEFKEQLQELKNTDKMHEYVINDILDETDEYISLKNHVKYIALYGCNSGAVLDLNYDVDTIKFYEKFQNEINSIFKNIQDNIILKILNRDFLKFEKITKKQLAWIGYEYVNQKLLRLIEEFEEI